MFKIQLNKQIHAYKGETSIEEVTNYIKKTFQLENSTYTLTYTDEESDEIHVSTTEDLQTFIEIAKKPLKLKINQNSEKSESSDSEEFIKIQKQEELKEEEKKIKEEQKKERKEKLQKIQEEMKEKMEQRKKERKEKFQQKKINFFKECKSNQIYSKKMQFFQKKIEKLLPELQEFVKQDFTYEKPQEQEEQKTEDQQKKPQVPFKQFVQQTFPMKFSRLSQFFSFQDKPPGKQGPCHKGGKFEKCRFNEDKENPIFKHRFLVHICDGCGKRPIKDFRYHCNECPDFDFCKECYETKASEHNHKAFEKLEIINPRVQKCKRRTPSPKSEDEQQQQQQSPKPFHHFPPPPHHKDHPHHMDHPHHRGPPHHKDHPHHKNHPHPKGPPHHKGMGLHHMFMKWGGKQPQQFWQKDQTQNKIPKFGPRVQMLAKNVAQVMDEEGKERKYLAVCKVYKKEGLEHILDLIEQDPEIVRKCALQFPIEAFEKEEEEE